jgi:hypothetical protein
VDSTIIKWGVFYYVCGILHHPDCPTTDSRSRIVSDSNGYSSDKQCIVDLLERIVTVSMRTVEIVRGLPEAFTVEKVSAVE